MWNFYSTSQTPQSTHSIRRCSKLLRKTSFLASARFSHSGHHAATLLHKPPTSSLKHLKCLVDFIHVNALVCVCLCVHVCATNIRRHISKQFSSVWAVRTPSQRLHRSDCMWFWGRSPGSPSPRGSGKRRSTPTSQWRLCNHHFN